MSIVSGTISAITQSASANKATNQAKDSAEDSIALQKEMYDTARADYAPYMEAGKNALYSLGGYTPVTGASGGATRQISPLSTSPGRAATQGQTLVPGTGTYRDKPPTPAQWEVDDDGRRKLISGDQPSGQEWVPAEYQMEAGPQGTQYEKTGAAMDPTGGADQYIAALKDYNEKYLGYDPGSYIKKIEDFGKTFTFDETDPAFKYKQEQLDKAINKSLSARGLYDSRAGINALSEGNKGLISDEVNQQYSRKYGALTDAYKTAATEDERKYTRGSSNILDQYNMTLNTGKTKYGATYDIARLGAGAAAGGAASALSSGQSIGSTYNALGAAEAQGAATQGTIAGQYMQGIQATPYNALATYNLGKKTWSGLGNGTATGAAAYNTGLSTGAGSMEAADLYAALY